MRVLVLLLIVLCLAYTNASTLDRFLPNFATDFIIKGHEAGLHDAPYIVSLSLSAAKHTHVCGGTLIAKDWVITAAHCIVSTPIGMMIAAGLHDRTRFNDFVQTRVVDFGKVHNDYYGDSGPYDIAILHVSKSFAFNQYVQPASLPVRKEIHQGTTNLYGWGQDIAFLPRTPRKLQTSETEIIEWNKCKAMLPKLHSSNLCSDSMEKHISACSGDSGGPLVREKPDTISELVGIVSWGSTPCGLTNKPSVYTRVSEFVSWITKIQSAYYFLYG